MARKPILHPNSCSGFLLLELLIASTIFLICLTASVQVLQISFHLITRSDQALSDTLRPAPL